MKKVFLLFTGLCFFIIYAFTLTSDGKEKTYNYSGHLALSNSVPDSPVPEGSCDSEAVLPIAEKLPPEIPTAGFTYSGNNGPAPCTVSFKNTSKKASTYIWNFGDNTTSAETDPKHIYYHGGNYIISLTAIGADGRDTLKKSIIIMVSYKNDLQPYFTAACLFCHNEKRGFPDLTEANSYKDIFKYGGIDTANPAKSPFYRKLSGKSGTLNRLDDFSITRLLQWITEGAKNN